MSQVIVADQHPIVRLGIKQVLFNELNIRDVIEASNMDEVIWHIRRSRCDLLILDCTLPDRSTLDILHEVRSYQAKLPILVHGPDSCDHFALRMIKAGATGFIAKSCTLIEFTTAVRKLLDGRKYVSEAITEQLIRELQKDRSDPSWEQLSEREYETLRLLVSGKRITEIAQMLSLSTKTVSTYRMRVLDKLGLQTNADMITYAINHNLNV